MEYANDKNGNKISIYEANSDSAYFCPICGSELIQRKGNINVPHFAHKQNSDLCDNWNYDMSDWHRMWQNLFPIANREVIITFQDVKHRADVLVGNTVIEFQHSRMSNEEFWERNDFYNRAGYKVVWLYDLIREYEDERVITLDNSEWKYKWNYHWHTFDDYFPSEDKNIIVYFQLGEVTDGDLGIEQLVWFSPNNKYFATKEYETYDKDSFVSLFLGNNKLTKQNDKTNKRLLSIIDLQDQLIEINNNYYHCFMNSSGYECFENCDCCVFSVRCINKNSIGKKYKGEYALKDDNVKLHAQYTSGCLYRFRDIIHKWNDKTDRVVDIKYNIDGKVMSFTVIKNGRKINGTSKYILPIGKTILELLVNTECKVLGVKNIRTGVRAKIGNSDYYKKNKIKKMEGYLGKSNDGYGYYQNKREIYNWNKSDWIIEWKK